MCLQNLVRIRKRKRKDPHLFGSLGQDAEVKTWIRIWFRFRFEIQRGSKTLHSALKIDIAVFKTKPSYAFVTYLGMGLTTSTSQT